MKTIVLVLVLGSICLFFYSVRRWLRRNYTRRVKRWEEQRALTDQHCLRCGMPIVFNGVAWLSTVENDFTMPLMHDGNWVAPEYTDFCPSSRPGEAAVHRATEQVALVPGVYRSELTPEAVLQIAGQSALFFMVGRVIGVWLGGPPNTGAVSESAMRLGEQVRASQRALEEQQAEQVRRAMGRR